MGKFTKTKRIYVDDIMAEIDVAMSDQPEAWGPHIDPAELDRIDQLREWLKSGDLKSASQEARLFSIKPLAM